MLAPFPVEHEVPDAFQYLSDNYRGLAGGTLFFSLLVHNVMASILILLPGVLVEIIPIPSLRLNGFFLGVVYRPGRCLSGRANFRGTPWAQWGETFGLRTHLRKEFMDD